MQQKYDLLIITLMLPLLMSRPILAQRILDAFEVLCTPDTTAPQYPKIAYCGSCVSYEQVRDKARSLSTLGLAVREID